MWNVTKALGCSPAEVPKLLFEGKNIASLVCEKEDLSGVSFNRSTIYSVTFDRCLLSRATFHGAKIKKMKFIGCGTDALFDPEPLVDENSEVTVMRTPDSGQEVYVGADISSVLQAFQERPKAKAKPPADFGRRALVLIFVSLFKADRRREDFPEKQKIQNRLRGWLQSFELNHEQGRALLAALSDAVEDLKKEGWICLNPNRPRTLVPCAARKSEIARIVRNEAIGSHLATLDGIASRLQEACNAIAASGPRAWNDQIS
jgi:hypothetical protein